MQKSTPVPDAPIDLNDVTREYLEGGCGLAPEVSGAIMAFRDEHGPWTSIEQLLEVPGIDASVLDALRQCVYVAPPGEDALPATADGTPVPEHAVDEQAGPSQPEPVDVAVVPPLAPAEPAGAEAFSEVELAEGSALDDALPTPPPGPEPMPESGKPEPGPIEDPSAVNEPLDYRAMTETATPGPNEGEGVSTARETPAVETVPECSPNLCSEAAAKPEYEEPAGAPYGETPALETASDGVTGDQEVQVTPLLNDTGKAEVESAQAEEPPAVVVDNAASLRTPESVGDRHKNSRSAAEPVAATGAEPVAPAPIRRRSVWHDIGMIVLGGLVGALLTLVILGGMGGTLSYAPRRLVDALSQNMSIMQDNQETTWSQLQSLTSRADALEKRLVALETLEDRVVELESGSAAMDAQLSSLSGGIDQLSADLTALESRQGALIQGLDTRMGSQERELESLGETVGTVRDTVKQMQDLVDKYESFFDALRDLLIDMQGDAVVESGA